MDGDDRVDAGPPAAADDELLVIEADEGRFGFERHGVMEAIATLGCVSWGLYLGHLPPVAPTGGAGASFYE